MGDDEAKVQWPGGAVSSTGDDLSQPAVEFLRDTELLARSEDQTNDAVSAIKGTPYSLQVINAGSLALSKAWAAVAAALGGGGAILAAIKAFYTNEGVVVRTALISGSAVALAITLLAVALIVRSDVDARARTTVALYEARARVAEAFLTITGSLQRPPETGTAVSSEDVMLAALAASKALRVSGPDTGGLKQVTGVRKSEKEGLQLRVGGGDWIPISNIESYEFLAGGS